MAKIMIAVTSTLEVTEKLAALQKRAQLLFITKYGYKHELTHGSLPFHITLVPPFEESEIEDGYDFPNHSSDSASSVMLTGIGIFMPTTVYARVDGPSGLEDFQDYFHAELSLKPKKPFVPHVSLARQFPEPHLHAVREVFEVASANIFPIEFPLTNITTYRNEGGRWARHQRHALAS